MEISDNHAYAALVAGGRGSLGDPAGGEAGRAEAGAAGVVGRVAGVSLGHVDEWGSCRRGDCLRGLLLTLEDEVNLMGSGRSSQPFIRFANDRVKYSYLGREIIDCVANCMLQKNFF